jgi:tRNA(adenine34) deaminase
MEKEMSDVYFMSLALKEAEKAAKKGEAPIGAVIVQDGKVISTAHNLREKKKNALYHAEILAIDKACKKLGGWRLPRCTLYVTLEPCPMCAGAIINSRIDRVVFGASDKKAGSTGSVIDLFSLEYNHKPICEGGVLAEECGEILTKFFKNLRKKEKN